MNRKLSSLVIFLFVLFLGGSAQAFQKFWWSNAGTNHLWDNLDNYWNADHSRINPPTIADFVGLDSPVPCYALIDVNTNAQCLELSVGSWAHYPAYDLNGLATLDVNEGTLTVATQLSIGERTSIAGNVTMGDVNILAGSVTVDTNMYIGREGIGMLNMRGGTLDINGTLRCPGGPLPPYNGQNYVCGTGMLNLYGGIISAGDFDVYARDITQINVEGGTLIVGGDKTSKVIDLVGQGKLYAYNGQGQLILDYNITNTGKTTITASYDPNLAFGPSPIDYAINITYNAQLQWRRVLLQHHMTFISVQALVTSIMPIHLPQAYMKATSRATVIRITLVLWNQAGHIIGVLMKSTDQLHGKGMFGRLRFAMLRLQHIHPLQMVRKMWLLMLPLFGHQGSRQFLTMCILASVSMM